MAETSILPTILPSIISAVSGLAGVGIGAWITLWKERAKEERERQADAKYLAVLVTSHLEKLARECVRIAWDRGIGDDGSPAGERHGDRIYEPTTKAPKFDPFTLDVNWKALEPDLMARILDLHGELAHLEHQVAGMVDNDPFPYDGAYFPHRRLWYAEFAERVVCISRDVRESLGIKLVHPTRFADLQDDCVEALDAARQEKERYEERRAEHHQKVMAVQEAIEAEEARKKATKQAPTDA